MVAGNDDSLPYTIDQSVGLFPKTKRPQGRFYIIYN